ncbi:MAG: tryptophan-rich sensory protein [Sulfitobacter litoralis]|jgi:hypothetical protein|uniref:TspO/MBR family protein n=2 Tax=root TaxID=1 RepID=A0A1H0SQL6_9RHOB|nr:MULTISPECIES: tryptophan-rich sensory protein [Sulfitobacter]MBQ0766516.1 tryptophan-rich sensory protein [Sulfitobacter litoralis]MBQ0802885.1 tryptophan-rich sensory protein [Sulfitobacter litoralis]MCF7726294.1 hypothetical protein [Sulfitobacter sp. M22]SDP44062.1 TspO/MBR family protein [Sulfitobacter litoralis]HDY96077.1 hypothetical protein [Sulfitobacter litoralis]
MSRPLTALMTFLLAIGFAVSPFFVSGFNGFSPDQFPIPQDNPPVQPAGYAFSIWGLIYVWLIVGMGWGLWKRREDYLWHDMRLPLALSLFVGCFWLAVAVASPVWASVLIWVMLITALYALFRSPREDRGFAALPVGLYAGWLSAASCVSLGLLAAGYGWMSGPTAGLVFVGLAIVIAAGVQSSLMRAPTYGIGVIWALVAVVVANMATAPSVAALAAGGAIALILPTYRSWRRG